MGYGDLLKWDIFGEVPEQGDEMLTLSSMEKQMVESNHFYPFWVRVRILSPWVRVRVYQTSPSPDFIYFVSGSGLNQGVQKASPGFINFLVRTRVRILSIESGSG